MSRLITNRRLFILLGSFIIVIVIAGVSIRGTTKSASLPERLIMDAQNTVAGWIYKPVSKVTAFLQGIHNLRQMYEENAQLKTELQNYSALKARLQLEEANNQKLKKAVAFTQSKQGQKYNKKFAQVISRDPSHWSSEITIDLGRADGVGQNSAVVAADGNLVGKVAVAAQHSAKVILLTDTQVGDGVSSEVLTNPKGKEFGIVRGAVNKPGQLQMSFLSPLAKIQTGDVVVTSGLGQIYPAGLVIGKIKSISGGAQGLTQTAIITPAANFRYLQDVFVVTKKGKK
ncbi:rod shape-determining protein MreC [Alicyclobacillus sp. SO9]|uniref:rod shape-determining protein MreC n=1 Tax=Alicyclobacillus sp. SO9 TaxID=2665646 RepID=UPI0018E90167|nr:rod shape-determining protein MreC [Alicyclobacillus sp. SO9]QQE77005.1 rod shape-determining protein MreC [Alicyclobacillus sp. SO9]